MALIQGPAGNAWQWGGIDPTKAAQVAAAAGRQPNPANNWGAWGQNFAGNVGAPYDPTQVAPAAPYNPMNGAVPGSTYSFGAPTTNTGTSTGTTLAPPVGNAAGTTMFPNATLGGVYNASAGNPSAGLAPGTPTTTGTSNTPMTGYTGGNYIPNANASYPLNVGAFLDPSMQFQMDQGLRALQSQASAQGQVNSGNTLRNILNYSQGLASTNYNTAEQQAAQQQQFQQNTDLLNQTVPFNQQLQLAQLGLQGAQGAGSLAATNAALQSGNLNTLGQVAGTGTIGANNVVNTTLSQLLSSLYGNQILSQLGLNG